MLAPQDAPGVDFGGFGSMPAWVLEGFGSMFSHVDPFWLHLVGQATLLN